MILELQSVHAVQIDGKSVFLTPWGAGVGKVPAQPKGFQYQPGEYRLTIDDEETAGLLQKALGNEQHGLSKAAKLVPVATAAEAGGAKPGKRRGK